MNPRAVTARVCVSARARVRSEFARCRVNARRVASVAETNGRFHAARCCVAL